MNLVDYANQLLRDYSRLQIASAMETMKDSKKTVAETTAKNPREKILFVS